MAIADRDITSSRTPGLHTDWSFNIAYNAALQLASAALAAAGFQAERAGHHYHVIQSLEFTVGVPEGTVQTLDAFRKKRNMSDYERSGVVSEPEAEEMLALAVSLRGDVEKWIAEKHGNLRPR